VNPSLLPQHFCPGPPAAIHEAKAEVDQQEANALAQTTDRSSSFTDSAHCRDCAPFNSFKSESTYNDAATLRQAVK